MGSTEEQYKIREREYICPCCGAIGMFPPSGKIKFTCPCCKATLKSTIEIVNKGGDNGVKRW